MSYFPFWTIRDIKLFLALLSFSLLAKGGAFFSGYATDDYSFLASGTNAHIDVMISQGRPLLAFIHFLIDYVNANSVSMHFPFLFLAVALQSALVVTSFRLVGYRSLSYAIPIGSFAVLHPYTSEILTFKMAMPGLAVFLLLLISALELLKSYSHDLKANIVIALLIFLSLNVYQLSINYLGVIIYALLLCGLLNAGNTQLHSLKNSIPLSLAVRLALLTGIAVFVYLVFFKFTLIYLGISPTSRSTFLDPSAFSTRISQIIESLQTIYILSDPLVTQILKNAQLLFLIGSGLALLLHLTWIKATLPIFGATLLLGVLSLPLSLGVIVLFNDYWPMPRVISHVSLLLGLIFLITTNVMPDSRRWNLLFLGAFSFMILGFIVANNQIFSDQETVNRWDMQLANRVVYRLETHDRFLDLRVVHVHGGHWGYPLGVRTLHGDMNISAFSAPWSKVTILSVASGYQFHPASGQEITVAENACTTRAAWPHEGSVDIIDGIGIVCFSR
jgi:hypothetical protein